MYKSLLQALPVSKVKNRTISEHFARLVWLLLKLLRINHFRMTRKVLKKPGQLAIHSYIMKQMILSPFLLVIVVFYILFLDR